MQDGDFRFRSEDTFAPSGVPIWYAVVGAGDPVILVHGFAVHAERNWFAPGIARALASDFRMVAFDLRGHGRSGKPHDPSAYGREVLADIVSLMDRLDVESAHVVGYSTGAQLALSFVTQFPRRVRRAVLGGGGMLETHGDEYEWYRCLPKTLSDLKPHETIAERLFPGVSLGEELTSVMNANDPAALSAFAMGMLELSHSEAALRANETPVLLLVGEDDSYRPQADAALAIGSNMHMIVQPRCDHSSALRDPGFVAAVRDFLKAG